MIVHLTHEKDGYGTRRHPKLIASRQLADARIAAMAQRGRRNVSLLFHTSKKATSKSCVVRRRLRSKMAAAIHLAVARNADIIHVPSASTPRLVAFVC